MPHEPETLWEKEQEEAADRDKVRALQELLGRENLPRRLRGKIFKIHGHDPKSVLISAHYIKLPNGSWIKKFDHKHRYHAYILPNLNIQIHTDFIKARGYHIASEYMIKDEFIRLRSFAPIPVIMPNAKRAEKRLMRAKYKKMVMPFDERKEALAKVKQFNEASRFKKKLLNFVDYLKGIL